MIKRLFFRQNISKFTQCSRYNSYYQSASFKFSTNSPSESNNLLKDSSFSKQLGLDMQMKNISKIEKVNENKNVRTSSFLIISVFVMIGGFIVIQLMDQNKSYFIWKRINQWQSILIHHNHKGYHQSSHLKQDHEYEKHLSHVFNKFYKNRVTIDGNFIKNFINHIRSKVDNIDSYQFSAQFKQLFNEIIKKDQLYEQIDSRNRFVLLQLYQQIIYKKHFLKDQESNGRNQNQYQLQFFFQQPVFQKICLVLLKNGNLNQQILGLRHTNILILSITDKTQIRSRIQYNKEQLFLSNQQYLNRLGSDLNEATFQDLLERIKKISQIRKKKVEYLSQSLSI